MCVCVCVGGGGGGKDVNSIINTLFFFFSVISAC